MDQFIYEELNKRWKAACKVIFWDEIGELKDFKPWLIGNSRKALERKSSATGKNVSLVLPYYSKSAKVASLNEIDLSKRFEPLNINQIKDMDSIIEAVQERVCYTGNIWLGDSKQIDESTDIINSSGILSSSQIFHSQWVAYCYNMEYGECLFGCQNTGYSKFAIRLNSSGSENRCFEMQTTGDSQDCYYCNSVFNSRDCMFSFNLRSSLHCIGNLRLQPDKYREIKKKLLAEFADTLKRKKGLPRLEEIFGPVKPNASRAKTIIANAAQPAEEPTNKAAIESAFEKTSKIIFGKELKNIERYGPYLKEHTRDLKIIPSAASGKKVVVPDHGNCFNYPESRIITQQESAALGKELSMPADRLDGFCLKNAGEMLNDIAFFSCGQNVGKLVNNIESEVSIDSQNSFRAILTIESKNSAYNYYALQSENVFGCNSVRKTVFSMRCYLSANLSRCFEVDSSRDCSDAYFCHNCENVRDSMFCFNVKNLTYAIGNAPVPRDKYIEIKKKVLSEIAAVLERDGKCSISIFNLSEKK